MKSPQNVRHLKLLSLSLGFTSVIAQVVYLREFATAFYGNETSYAVILAAWLCGVSLGSFILSRITSMIREPQRVLAWLLMLKALMIPAGILAIRSVKMLFNIPTGQIIGMIPMIASAFLLLMPVTFVLGAFYTLLCRWAEDISTQNTVHHVGTIYIWEAAGAGIGGILVSFILIRLLSAWTIAVWLGAVNLLLILSVLKRRYLRLYNTAFIFLLVLMVFSLAGVFKTIESWSRAIQWRDFEVVDVIDSKYANLTLVKRFGEYSLFENGLLSFSTGDTLAAENTVHFALSAHPQPRRVLLIGNGLNGTLKEILKYPRITVDYVELDPQLLDFAQQYLPPDVSAPLRDSRVTLIHADARQYVKRTSAVYDVILVNLGDPITALLNRYYTLEFYWETVRILKQDGLLGFSVSSSENYLNPETRDFLQSLFSTAGQVFKQVHIIPGDINVFLASRSAERIPVSADFFGDRLKQRGISTRYINEAYLPFRLNDLRMNQIRSAVQSSGRVNTDMRPIAFLYDIILWSTHFNTGFRNMMARLQSLTFLHLMAVPLLIFGLGFFLMSRNRMLALDLSIATTGFSEIVYQVIVILAFQVLYGYVYYKIGVIVTSFMAGLILGGWMARRMNHRSGAGLWAKYCRIQAGITLYPLLLPFVFQFFGNASFAGQEKGIFSTLFAILPVAAGFMGGMQYVLAVNLRSRFTSTGESTSKISGLLYGLDVLGSTFGALLAGAILIPLLGINQVAYFCVVLNAVVLILLIWNNKFMPLLLEM